MSCSSAAHRPSADAAARCNSHSWQRSGERRRPHRSCRFPKLSCAAPGRSCAGSRTCAHSPRYRRFHTDWKHLHSPFGWYPMRRRIGNRRMADVGHVTRLEGTDRAAAADVPGRAVLPDVRPCEHAGRGKGQRTEHTRHPKRRIHAENPLPRVFDTSIIAHPNEPVIPNRESDFRILRTEWTDCLLPTPSARASRPWRPSASISAIWRFCWACGTR